MTEMVMDKSENKFEEKNEYAQYNRMGYSGFGISFIRKQISTLVFCKNILQLLISNPSTI